MLLNHVIDNTVKQFVKDIVDDIKEANYHTEIDVDYDMVENKNGTQQANRATIISKLGVVVIFPDFEKVSAIAAMLNMGEVNRMLQEGFSDEQIQSEGRIYSDLLPYNLKSVQMVSWFLTNKLTDAPAKS